MIEEIRSDHLSGASEISRKCARYLGHLADGLTADGPEEYLSKLAEVGKELIRAQPTMAPVFNTVNAVLNGVQDSMGPGVRVEDLRQVAKEKVERFIANSDMALEKIGKYGAGLIASNRAVMTYSASRTVLSIFDRARREGKSFRVIVPESRPMCEGRNLAHELGKGGIPSILIVDGAMSAFLERVDLLLVGADRISRRWLVNKVGTRGMAILAREFKVPVYSACETSKFLPEQAMPFEVELKDPGEICEEPVENVRIENIYFEETELELLSGIVTESGILPPDSVRRVMEGYRINEALR